MAEEDSDLEKTEEASPRKLEKAREEGDVPRSRELATFTSLLAAAAGFWLTGHDVIRQLEQFLQANLRFESSVMEDFEQYRWQLFAQLLDLFWACVPLFGLLILVAIASPMLIGGWLFSGKLLQPKFSRLNPLQGLTNMLSKNALIELCKALAKTILISVVVWLFFRNEIDDVFTLQQQGIEDAAEHHAQLLLSAFSVMVAALALIALFDAPYQLYRYSHKLMMTRQEQRDESKESDGNPEIKAKIRAQQREMARRRMMSQVPTADVVVTNPTHYAVALKYPDNSDQAPIVVAKGVDITAERIKTLAAEHGVAVMEAPALARALYTHTELEAEIPTSLFTAVAQVLAYVFQLRDWQRQGGLFPQRPQWVSVPAGMDPLESGDLRR